MIKGIIFDFGLVISTPRPKTLVRAYEAELGIARDTLNPILFESPAWQAALVGRLGITAFWHTIGPQLGLPTRSAADAFRRRYYADEKANPAVLELIRRLRVRYRLAILSNHPPGLSGWLRDWGIRDDFAVVYCSGDEGRVKPDPVVYTETLARLAVRPDEAVFIDDTAGHVAAGRALGIHGIHFTHARQLASDLAALLGDQSLASLSPPTNGISPAVSATTKERSP